MSVEQPKNEKTVLTVSQIIESVCADICDNYCKFLVLRNKDPLSFDEDWLEKICADCPLGRL